MNLDNRKATPEVLYHYTTQTGFLGIIQSKTIWATDMRYLNDKREYLVALERLKERVTTLAESAEAGSPPAIFLAKVHQRLANIWGWPFFVASFSEDGDLLSQWRGYGQGGGYALGIRGEFLAEGLRARDWTLASCLYDGTEHGALIDRILIASIDMLKDPDSEEPIEERVEYKPLHEGDPRPSFDLEALFPMPKTTPHWMKDAMVALWRAFSRNGPRIKDEAFREEKEWRAISSNETYGLVKVRPGAGVMRPYILVSLDRAMSLAEVVVGPSAHQELSKHAAECALQQHQVYCERVRLSKVPYRDW